MKSPLVSFALCVSVLAAVPPGSQARSRPGAVTTSRKFALLVGAWDYERTSAGDFDTLKSEGRTPGPLEDVEALRRVLVGRLGFGADDVRVLTSRAETTRASILRNFRTFLVEQTRPGDLIYFHYSGHGSQLPDRDLFDARGRPTNKNPLVDEPDGLDETLVPTDYGVNGTNEIRDDELNVLVASLMERRPGGVVLTFDCCHSGTLSRGGWGRGKGWKERTEWVGPKPTPPAAARGRSAGMRDGLLEPAPTAATGYVAISAARERERAWQVYDPKLRLEMGRFTQALVTALAETDSRTTYEDLFVRIRTLMANRYADQHPQFEGPDGKTVLGGAVKDRPTYLPVYTNRRGELILDAGVLHGVTEGSVVALYPMEAGELSAAVRLATAEVTAVRLSDSTLALRADTTRAQMPVSMKGVEVEHSYGPERMSLLLEGGARAAQEQAVLNEVRRLAVVNANVKAGAPWDLRLRATDEPGGARVGKVWLLERSDGSEVGRVADAEGAAERIAASIRREAKWRHVKSLENRNPLSLVKVKMRIVRVEVRGDCERGLSYVSDAPEPFNPPRLRVGDAVAVEVMNLGSRDAYVTLFDLSSEGDIMQLWPDPRQPITDNFISAAGGGWVRLWSGFNRRPALFCITEPGGTDIFKLISTMRHIDFRSLRTRTLLPPLDAMLRAALDDAGAGGPPINVADDWYTDALAFDVIR